ncbi:MAG: DUF4115 domain-containing protein [Gammaproteobacteria bacterium]|nr:DUF4115 domain-containing protein [Gammaproteobacteria bacterium]
MSDSKEEELQQEQEAQTQQPLPGRRLAEARESAGISRAEVAAQMRINERMVASLEEDDYEAFPSAAYVSGYLRSYARILGLPEAEFVKPLSSRTEAPAIVSTIGRKEQVSSRALPVRLVTYLLAGVVLVSLVMWLYTQRDAPVTFTGGPQDVAEEEGVDGSGPSLSVEPENMSPDEAKEPEIPGSDDDALEAEPDVAEPDEPVVKDAPVSAVDNRPAETEPAPREVQSEETAAQQQSTAPLTAATPVSRLELRYQEKSWTEVSDNAGRRLAYGLIKANQTLVLTGEAPFRVFLGYAPGVTVYYNDELFDHSPFQRRDVARFRVGRAEHNLPGSR